MPGSIFLNTYTMIGSGVPYVSKRVERSQPIWTYLYMGHSHDEGKVYGAVIQPGLNSEIVFKNIRHKLSTRLLLTVGADDYYASFNGKIAFCNFYVGPRSYREGLDFGNEFGYGDGA